MRTELGKIKHISFGYGGYDDAMIGYSVTLGGETWGVSAFEGTWATEPDKHANWDISDQTRIWGETCRKLRDLLKAANKKTVADLKGVPIEATFDGMTLKSWRILTEVV